MAEELFLADQGALWVQLDGPNTKPVYLGCHDVDDVVESLGGKNLIQCFDVNGNYRTLRSTREAPDPVTTTITTYIGQVVDVLEQARCPFTLFLHQRCGGKADIFGNYDRTTVIVDGEVTQRTKSNLVRRNEKSASEHAFAVSGNPPLLDFFKFRGLRVSVSETENLTDIRFCNEARCQGPCSTAQEVCQDGVITAAAGVGVSANVLFTTNGSTFTAGATDPFGADEDAGEALCFQVDQTTTRTLVFRTETDAGAPAEGAYTSDNGATWTATTIGAVNGQFVTGSFALDANNVWVGTDDGYIYYSDDGGTTWTIQEAGVITANAINSIHFLNQLRGYAGGDSDVIMFTLDGGVTWSATNGNTGTADNITAVRMMTNDKAWVSTSGAEMYYTNDAGDTWNLRAHPESGDGTITDFDFLNITEGALVQTTGAGDGVAYTTIDGGFNWELVRKIPSNAGLNAVHWCATDLFYAVGDASGGTGFVLKVTTS